MKLILIVCVVVVGLALAYVRLAPQDLAQWHVAPPPLPEDQDALTGEGSHLQRVDLPLSPVEAMRRVAQIAADTPRTQVLAGRPEDGMITFVTRSLAWGFPDYTTVTATGDQAGARVVLYGRLRFGRSDLGVNAKRVRAWCAALQG